MYDIDADAIGVSINDSGVVFWGDATGIIGTSRFDMMRALAIRKKAESP